MCSAITGACAVGPFSQQVFQGVYHQHFRVSGVLLRHHVPVQILRECNEPGKCRALGGVDAIRPFLHPIFQGVHRLDLRVSGLPLTLHVPVQILREYNLCGKCWALDGVDAIGPFTELVSPDAPSRYTADKKVRSLLLGVHPSPWKPCISVTGGGRILAAAQHHIRCMLTCSKQMNIAHYCGWKRATCLVIICMK